MTVSLWARAKINLTLDIAGVREDGYHLLSSVMQSVSLADKVSITRTDKPGQTFAGKTPKIDLWTSLPYVPRDGRNTAYQAAAVFAAHTGLPLRVRIAVRKAIPVGAGLAGGSADAAAVLRGLNQLYQTNLSDETLIKLGLAVGADVPFCLFGGTAKAEGIGEVLSALPPMPFCHIVLCKPPISLKTREIFAAYDAAPAAHIHKTAEMVNALTKNDFFLTVKALHNDLLPAAAEKCGHIETIRALLHEYGAQGAMMSGSGPTVFGLFSSRRRAIQAADRLKSKYRETFVTNPAARPESKTGRGGGQ